jgi:hypothetical protein
MKNTHIKKETNIVDSTLSIKGTKILTNINYSKNINYEKDKISLFSSNDSKIKNNKSSKKGKHVTFTSEVEVINVENWKKYNYEQTAEEDYQGYIEEIEKNKKYNNSDNSKGRFRDKAESTNCTCFII